MSRATPGSEERARLEDAPSRWESERGLESSELLAWPGEEREPQASADPGDALWGRCRNFDCGDLRPPPANAPP
jgi:hypothetical protein